MDYSKMSDFEINMKVAELFLDYDSISQLPHIGMSVHWGDGANWHTYNPCNNPADAWPIINASRISIMFDGTDPQYEGEHHEWCDAISSCQKFGTQHQSNPLRAAMVVYLMMQESANVQDNPA
ncbi:phage protein NinX family protein [Enterobacter kobei]|uniref:Protein ninX n=2 Tax=Enterobacter kobei TaxID=208224 RepID=A0ACC8SDA6_9ENTR|nr:phage protein NinX family protein [Enterobacter kobei]OLR21500.1 protein ninX [Enterobacter kobei]BCU55104.1 hypothetical protein ENKO_16980 [Enterobacter kobei]SIQ96658.1 Protein of unknown function [Enterobacter kobei]